MTTEEILKELSKMEDLKAAYRKKLEEYIKERLAENNNFINFADLEDSVCVSYDGGGHPEYASNLYSVAYAISLNEKGEAELELEDDDEYNIDRCTLADVECVAYGVIAFEEMKAEQN